MLEKIDVQEIINIAKEAGTAIMQIYEQDYSVEYKDDKSPLTQADTKSNEIICSALRKLYPDIPIMSEENKETPYEERKNWSLYWCIDPIDGTKEFIKKNGEFTINIALIVNNEPTMGVVYAPAIDTLYYADDSGAFKILGKETFALPQKRDDNKFIIVASKSHLNEETKAFIDSIETQKEKKFLSKGSSLKLCMVAEGSADIYPRLAPTMEWDTAAADAIVRKSGKNTYRYEHNVSHQELITSNALSPLRYNKENLLNEWFVVF